MITVIEYIYQPGTARRRRPPARHVFYGSALVQSTSKLHECRDKVVTNCHKTVDIRGLRQQGEFRGPYIHYPYDEAFTDRAARLACHPNGGCECSAIYERCPFLSRGITHSRDII